MKLLWNSKERNYIQQDYVISATVFILAVCTLTSFADFVRDELWFDADLSVVNNGRNIDEVVMHVDDVDFAQCTMYCVQHLKCKSVNYNENERMCELCDSDFNEADVIVDGMTGWKNYGAPPKQDGGYSEWIYGVCSVTCGYGEQVRYRRCNSPPPRYGGADCQGPYLESICCKVKECPVHGAYSTWSTFGNCSRWCGGGVQMRNRSCNNPPPSLGGENCSLLGVDTETRSCNEEPCQVRFINPKTTIEGSLTYISGYIAIQHKGEWGLVCDDAFDKGDNPAKVFCRMAGFKGGNYHRGKYKIGDGQLNGIKRTDMRIWLDAVRCTGDERDIDKCHIYDGWGIHNCNHEEDVGIKCWY